MRTSCTLRGAYYAISMKKGRHWKMIVCATAAAAFVGATMAGRTRSRQRAYSHTMMKKLSIPLFYRELMITGERRMYSNSQLGVSCLPVY